MYENLQQELKKQFETIKKMKSFIIGLLIFTLLITTIVGYDLNKVYTRDEIFEEVSEINNIPTLIYNETTKFYTSVDGNYTYLAYDLDNNITVFKLEHAEYIKIGSKFIYAGKNQTQISLIPIKTNFKFK